MLEAQNLSYDCGVKPLFSSLSFTLNEGEMLGVRGTNGAGKTTLLRLLAGLSRPSSGVLLWKGHKEMAKCSQNLLYVGHKFCLHAEGRVKDHIKIWQKLYGLPGNSLDEAMRLWGLGTLGEKKVAHLSQGQQKRLSLSRCSWLARPLWILDEPHTSLDSEGRQLLDQQMHHHLEQGGMIILATHESLPCSKEIQL